jgi:pyridoxamine 5'-phosphate oxidase
MPGLFIFDKWQTKMNLAELRKNYTEQPLLETEADQDPMVLFETWMKEAVAAELPEPNSFVLSTVDLAGKPSSRVILLKGVDDGCFVFYTNYQSRKSMEIDHNPNVALNFLWLELARQIRITGRAAKVSSEISDLYFNSRPYGSRIGAHVSNQSTVIAGRKELDDTKRELEEYFSTHPLLRPKHWGGYAVKPEKIEFWKGRSDRLHDRLEYTKKDTTWEMVRLAP